jgi:methylated-DNA-[protein]-cysteine S-methyltransferase
MGALRYCHVESPIGRLLLAGDEVSLRFLSFPGGHKAFGPKPGWREGEVAPFAAARAQLAAYFAGELRRFDLPLVFKGTPFQTAVWSYLPRIGFGETKSYGEIARDLGAPGASRAVGAANGANPLPIFLPCHRVIGASGALTGFGGGLPTKRFLLAHEGALPTAGPEQPDLFGG